MKEFWSLQRKTCSYNLPPNLPISVLLSLERNYEVPLVIHLTPQKEEI